MSVHIAIYINMVLITIYMDSDIKYMTFVMILQKKMCHPHFGMCCCWRFLACRDNGRYSIARTCVNWGSLHEPFHVHRQGYYNSILLFLRELYHFIKYLLISPQLPLWRPMKLKKLTKKDAASGPRGDPSPLTVNSILITFP